ncbi:hypothetical protein SAMN06298216_0408 [Spirosomataceae bacterium TFI 002]|nr:hypothetical protein SAMN06298216_0408 [Spirosomataceae bacterium TFI 002]
MKNPGYDPIEIENLKRECEQEGLPFVLVEDEIDLEDTGEYAQFQFVGRKNGDEVIYDVAMFTLRMQHSSKLLEEAEALVKKKFKDFVPLELRNERYKANEDADQLVQEYVEELEEDESVTVSETIEEDLSFEYGIGLEVVLNVDEIDDRVITKFINEFNSGALELDTTQISFKHSDDED